MPYTRLLDSPGKWGTPLTPFAYLRLRWEKCAGFRLAPWMAHVENPDPSSRGCPPLHQDGAPAV